ncbi:YybH family protein [Micromonosporaceae bacterium Da 78-11]
MEFVAAVQEHLAAVGKRDLPGYLGTVHDDVSLIMPNGKVIEGRDAVAAFHRDWFDDPDWSWVLTPVRTITAGDTGVAVLAVEYHDLDGAGQAYTMRYLLSLTFVRQAGTWLLLHDQNTLLNDQTASAA